MTLSGSEHSGCSVEQRQSFWFKFPYSVSVFSTGDAAAWSGPLGFGDLGSHPHAHLVALWPRRSLLTPSGPALTPRRA